MFQMNYAKDKVGIMKCYKHYRPITHVNLEKICPNPTRITCDQCEIKNFEIIPIAQFISLCSEFKKKMERAQNPNVQKIRNHYTNILQQLNNLIQILNSKIQNALYKATYSDGVVEGFLNQREITIQIFVCITDQYPYKYGLKDFETLAQHISASVEYQRKDRTFVLIEHEVDDQRLAEFNEYCDLTKQLVQMIEKFYVENNIIKFNKDSQINQEEDKNAKQIGKIKGESQKLITNVQCHVADVQLNFDETIIGARYAETMNQLQFWKLNENRQWSSWTTLVCHPDSLVNFQFSKKSNFIITCGVESSRGLTKSSTSKLWELDDQQNWIQKEEFYKSISRLSCQILSYSEKILVIGDGKTIVIFDKIGNSFTHQQNKLKSSEIITALRFNLYDTLLAVGASDQKVILWKYQDKKLTIQQEIKLYNTPKKILFNSVLPELYISTTDGLVHLLRKNQQNEYIEQQRIVNNIEKIRTIGISQDSSIIAIGGETNAIQLWGRQNNTEWKCCQEILQEEFVESVVFGNSENLIVSSSNTNIYVHYKYY